MTGAQKDLQAVLRRLERAGCRVLVAGSGHVRVLAPNGSAITASRSPRSPYAAKNVVRDARKFLGIAL